jgi:4-hydroxy-4-methyl-2-oxoglutarate aldolase
MDNNIVYRRVLRPKRKLVERAAALRVSDLYETLENRDAAMMSNRMRPLVNGLRIAGPAVTAHCAPGDNLMMHKALLLAEPGDVLVVAGGEPSGAQWGYLAALYAEQKGLAGVVVHGAIRDVDVLRERHYPVWCTEISPAHPEKRAGGSVNAPAMCAGVRVCPGDIVCADGDGVLVLPHAHAQAAIEQAEARQGREEQAAEAILAGRSLFELHDLAAAFAQSGAREIDDAWSDPTSA